VNITELALCSDAASSELVASSSAKIAGFFSSARAIASRCLWPPLKLRRPTAQEYHQILHKRKWKGHKLSVSNPFGIPRMNSQFASRAAASMSSRVASLFPKAMFDAMVPVKRTGSWAAVIMIVDVISRLSTCLGNNTNDVAPRRRVEFTDIYQSHQCFEIGEMVVTHPGHQMSLSRGQDHSTGEAMIVWTTCHHRSSRYILLRQQHRQPEARPTHTIATLSPTPISRFKSSRICTPGRLGYSNPMFSNLIGPRRDGSTSMPPCGGIAGARSSSSNIRAPAPIPRIMDD
jgi:hypothetical protein